MVQASIGCGGTAFAIVDVALVDVFTDAIDVLVATRTRTTVARARCWHIDASSERVGGAVAQMTNTSIGVGTRPIAVNKASRALTRVAGHWRSHVGALTRNVALRGAQRPYTGVLIHTRTAIPNVAGSAHAQVGR